MVLGLGVAFALLACFLTATGVTGTGGGTVEAGCDYWADVEACFTTGCFTTV